jgi:hypothetical protein
VALLIETGQARSDSQSYASAADLKAYALARGVTVPSTDAACEALLMKAMDRLLDENFVGDRSTRDQALPWPRIYATVEGWWIKSNEIPRNLIYAQCAFAVAAQTVDLLPTQDLNAQGPVIEEEVGPVRTAYANKGVVRRVPAVASADALLRTLVRRSGLMAVRV